METKNIVLTTIGVLFAGFVIALIAFNVNEAKESEKSADTVENLTMHEQYSGLPEDNRFVEEPGSQIIDTFENGTGIILLGFKECPWCQKTVPLLNQAAEAEDLSVHYLDIREERSSNSYLYRELIAILEPYLKKDENGTPTISTPDISYVKDGEIVWRFEMEETTIEELTPDTYWTEERKERALADFRENMQLLR